MIFNDYRGFGDVTQGDIDVWRVSHPGSGLTDLQVLNLLNKAATDAAAIAGAAAVKRQQMMNKLTGGQALVAQAAQEAAAPVQPVVDLSNDFVNKMKSLVAPDHPNVTADPTSMPIPGTGLTVGQVSSSSFFSAPVLIGGGLAAAFVAYKLISKK